MQSLFVFLIFVEVLWIFFFSIGIRFFGIFWIIDPVWKAWLDSRSCPVAEIRKPACQPAVSSTIGPFLSKIRKQATYLIVPFGPFSKKSQVLRIGSHFRSHLNFSPKFQKSQKSQKITKITKITKIAKNWNFRYRPNLHKNDDLSIFTCS